MEILQCWHSKWQKKHFQGKQKKQVSIRYEKGEMSINSTLFDFDESVDIPASFLETNQQMQKLEKWRPPYVNLPLFAPTPSFKVGDVILDRYEVKKLLHGSMGDVYQCYDRYARCDIAMKTLISGGKSNRMQLNFFYEEIEERLKLDRHQNVVYLRYVESVEGYPYTVSEWVEGDEKWGNSLVSWMASYPLGLHDIVNFLLQITAGLSYCYEQISTKDKCFVLGDLKPENILVEKGNIFKLMDFSTHSYTEKWASPEQKRREVLDVRSDIYTLGRIAYEMLKLIQIQESETLSVNKVKELINRCIEYNRQERIASYTLLNEELYKVCKELEIEIPKNKIQHRTYLDCLYRFHSFINLGRKVPTYFLENMSLQLSGYGNMAFNITMNSYMEFVRINDRSLYEAEAAIRLGKEDEALKILEKNREKLQDLAKYYYICGLAYYSKGDFIHALYNFEKASEEELFFSALDMEANIMLQNPDLYHERQGHIRAQTIVNQLFRDIDKKATGYLANQAYGKFLMLLGNYQMASRAFQESLNYPNAEEWNNLYYFGLCESNQGNYSASAAIFSTVIQMIDSDNDYINDGKKATTLMLCWNFLGNEEEMEKLVLAIREKFGWNYQYLLDSLRHDKKVYTSYWQRIHEDENRYTDPFALQNSMHELINSFERDKKIQNGILICNIVNAVCSREIAYLFDLKKYREAIAVCDRALSYDHYHPDMLQNKGACYFMLGEFLLAHCCYVLAEYYEQDLEKKEKAKQICCQIRREHPEVFGGKIA